MNDLINGMFELLAAGFILNHARAVLKDKAVAGVSILSVVFFTGWGFWNIYYYPALGQTLSFYAGIAVVLANLVWLGMLWRYRNAEDDERAEWSEGWPQDLKRAVAAVDEINPLAPSGHIAPVDSWHAWAHGEALEGDDAKARSWVSGEPPTKQSLADDDAEWEETH